MTANQTIDGHLRDLLERVVKYCEFWHSHPYISTLKDIGLEARALLDAPASEAGKSDIASALESSDWAGTSIGNKVLVAAAITELRKAAQPQGEPVADVHVMTIDPHYPGAGRQVYVNWRHGQQEAVLDGAKLYAEQPAPVAVPVITYQQVFKAYGYAEDHPHKYLRGTTNWCAAVAHKLNACLDEVTRLNNQ